RNPARPGGPTGFSSGREDPALLFGPDLGRVFVAAEYSGDVVDEGGVHDPLLGGAAEEEHGGARLTADAEGHEDVGRGEDLFRGGLGPLAAEDHGAELQAGEGSLVDKPGVREAQLHLAEGRLGAL